MRALAVALALVAGFWLVGAANPPAPPVLQGDRLGPEDGETIQQYAQRAAGTLDHEEASFALVTFARPLGPDEAAAALAPAPRVSALVVPGEAPVVVPEASIGTMRIDVLRSATTSPIAGAVVFAPRTQLEQMNATDTVFAVEMLPADAVWGAFSITTSATRGGV
ncbi:hypothetical protein HMPREF3151_08875 [Corynebacterium sp. HMSC05H05]|uniref:hypothetical protein n=1 Tax=Corynebacterium sp. HMSC05H05 TaxID=1581119 RepID=UPI0008A2AF4C|nr:hypothetical protein [Corynebacterium sp. HMSC05H05]OFT57071.1 hypothetical protein HMPREF3151_08875 [Corynebacterium sp. HMSC05H05]